MSSLMQRLRGPSAKSRGAVATTTPILPPSSPSGVQMFLIEVIAFGEVYAVPVTKATPATVVLRYVMEAAVSQEDAAHMGSVEATLYYKEKPLPLDTVMGKLPKRAVLHLHSSLSTTSSVVRDRRQSAVSMLPQDRQRYASTTVTMQPVLKEGSGAREGSGSTVGGISSDGGSPNAERNGSAAESIFVTPSMYGTSVMTVPTPAGVAAAPMMMFAPVMFSGGAGYPTTAAPAMVPYYCCMPVGSAGPGIRMLGAQGRTVSAPRLSASRRRDSAVEFANSYHFPLSENPLNKPADTLMDAADATSPPPSPPSTRSAAQRRFSIPSDDNYVVVFLRLPRDRAAVCMSTAAISGDSNIEMTEVEPEEMPQAELLNATFSTVATSKSQVACAYSYRRLRVRKDFPVGTLRELCAVEKYHRLHLAHNEITDETKSFSELGVPANAVFYFRATQAKTSPNPKSHTLTRERLREHLEMGTTATPERSRDLPARSPSHIDAARPSLDRSLPSPAATPTLSAVEPQFQDPRQQQRERHCSGGATSSTTSIQSIHERILAFNDGAVRNPNYSNGEDEGERATTTEEGQTSVNRYVVEGKELTITSAVAAEQARCQAELAARQAAVEAERAGCPSSPTGQLPGQPAVLPIEKEGDVDVDVMSEMHRTPPAPTAPMTHREGEVAGQQMAPDLTLRVQTATATVAQSSQKEKTLGKTKKALRWLRRSPSTSSGKEAKQHKEQDKEGHPIRADSRSSSQASPPQRGPHPTRVSRIRKIHSKRVQKSTDKPTASAAAPSSSPDLESSNQATDHSSCAPLVPDDIDRTAGATPAPAAAAMAIKQVTSKREKATRTHAPVNLPPELHSCSDSVAAHSASGYSSRTSSIVSLKTKFQRLTKRRSKNEATGAKSRSASGSHLIEVQPTSTTPSEEVLNAAKLKSERLSRKRAKLAATAAAAAAATNDVPLNSAIAEGVRKREIEQHQLPIKADALDTKAVTPTKEEVENTADSRPAKIKVLKRGTACSPSSDALAASSPLSYSERRRQSADAVPRQPVSFLGSNPSDQQQRHPQAAADGLGGTHSSNTLDDVSATLGPAALSTTRLPLPRNSPSPVSILASSPELRTHENSSAGSAEKTKMTEANINSPHRRGVANSTPESRADTDYSVESTGSLNRLRITIMDPEDSTRFHYGVPVEPNCPVGALREWFSAMQPTVTVMGKTPPSLRDVDRYGVFAGDTYLRDEGHLTFGEVTCGRNDVVFSIRSRF